VKKILFIGAVIAIIWYFSLDKKKSGYTYQEEYWLNKFRNYPGIKGDGNETLHAYNHLRRLRKFHSEKLYKKITE
jgi:hypothetical protein